MFKQDNATLSLFNIYLFPSGPIKMSHMSFAILEPHFSFNWTFMFFSVKNGFQVNEQVKQTSEEMCFRKTSTQKYLNK